MSYTVINNKRNPETLCVSFWVVNGCKANLSFLYVNLTSGRLRCPTII